MRDPYEVLGLDRNASAGDVRSAFRRLAAEHHPDRNQDDPSAVERFKEVNQAYQILEDAEKRAAWDRYGEAAFRPGGAGPDHVHFDLSLDALFGDLLGAFGLRTGQRGDVKETVTLTLEEAATGCDKVVHYDCTDTCDRCSGSGGEPETEIVSCSACSGSGKVRFRQGVLPFAVERPCSRCRGRGRTPTVNCTRCRGTGLTKHKRKADIEIPPGVDSGTSRVVQQAGHRLRPEAAPGDLEVTIQVQDHPFFKRSGDDVVCEVPITFAQAALGSEIDVPTLSGKVKLRVPPATQPGNMLRVKGKGMPRRIRGGRGDQLVEVSVEVPTQLTDRARELIEQLAGELGEEVQPQQRTFLEKLKTWFG
ncbi:MAG: molecular chaperone DnaJ [Polyangiaceae bacterium]